MSHELSKVSCVLLASASSISASDFAAPASFASTAAIASNVQISPNLEKKDLRCHKTYSIPLHLPYLHQVSPDSCSFASIGSNCSWGERSRDWQFGFETSRFRNFCQIFEGFGFGKFGFGKNVSVSVSEKFGLGKKSRFRFRKIWSRKKSIGFGFGKIWSRKKVSVSENLVS